MAEFLILCVILAMCWSYYSDWRERQDMERCIQHKVALRQKYVTLAPDAPSAWESFGDALRQGGYLPEALEAYERAEQLKVAGRETAPPLETPEGTPAVAGIDPLYQVALPLPETDSPENTPHPRPVPMPPVATTPTEANPSETLPALNSHPAPMTALVALGPARNDNALYTSSEQLVAEARQETGLSLDDGPDFPVVTHTPSGSPQVAPPKEQSPLTPYADSSTGFGLVNKKRLVLLEMEQENDPAKFGQTMRTRQQVCRQCGYLNDYHLRDCRVCGAPLPVNTLLDAWQHDAIRREALREATNLVIGVTIVGVCVWFVGWLPDLVKISVTISALIVIPIRLLHGIGNR